MINIEDLPKEVTSYFSERFCNESLNINFIREYLESFGHSIFDINYKAAGNYVIFISRRTHVIRCVSITDFKSIIIMDFKRAIGSINCHIDFEYDIISDDRLEELEKIEEIYNNMVQ